MYALVDCNNFYVSCERVFNPALNGRPVIVLSNNDGCAVSRSNEAKALGIGMGSPVFELEDLIRRHDVAVFSSNYALYGDMSQRVMDTLAGFATELEVYSIDESFLDMSGFQNVDIQSHCRDIRQAVLRNTGIPVSVGVSLTKTLAKLANEIAKKQSGRNGVCILNSQPEIEQVLRKADIEDVWGIGHNSGNKLRAHGIHTAYDYTQADKGWIRQNMTVVGARIQEELLGRSCLPLELVRPAKQAICTSRSFGAMTSDKEAVGSAVASFAAKCAYKLRKQGSAAKYLTVFLNTNRFRADDKQYYGSKVITLPVAANSDMEIVKYAKAGFNEIFRRGYRYKKAGVLVTGIVDEDKVQQDLFYKVDRDRQGKLMKIIDSLNDSMGRGTVRLAGQGTSGKCKLKRERLSPAYTTKWKDIVTVNAG